MNRFASLDFWCFPDIISYEYIYYLDLFKILYFIYGDSYIKKIFRLIDFFELSATKNYSN